MQSHASLAKVVCVCVCVRRSAACTHSAALSDCMRNVFIQPNPPTAVSPSESLLSSLGGIGRLKREKQLYVCYQWLLSLHCLYSTLCIFHPAYFLPDHVTYQTDLQG